MYFIVEVTNAWEEISQEGRPGHVALVLMERAGCSPRSPLLLGGKSVCTLSLLQFLSPICAQTASLFLGPTSVHRESGALD